MKDVKTIKGIGEASAKLLYKLGLKTTKDLIENIPRKYDDFSVVQSISSLRPGIVTVKAKIVSVKGRYSKRGLHITEAIASDETGSVKVMWFNQPYRATSLKSDSEYYLSGEFAQNYKYLVISNPVIELVSAFPINTARLVPIYKLTKGLGSQQLRRFTKLAFEVTEVVETLPKWIIQGEGFMDRRSALFQMHFPKTLEDVAKARARIGFEELFDMMLASELNKQEFLLQKGLKIPFAKNTVKKFVDNLPFKLTDDQRKAAWEILQDMDSGTPMNRLLEGDVGSGKTVVAAICAVNVSSSGYQTAIMAPTEILASQHMVSLQKILLKEHADTLCYVNGAMTKKEKQLAYDRIMSGEAKIIVGTHALIQEALTFHNLGLVVIDEQHRFGVEQRKMLQAKASIMPHVLHMTATPIPRSIALTLYGELSVSIIEQKPKNRQAIQTTILQPEQRQEFYQSLSESLAKSKGQAFVVCPQIIESERPGRSLSVEHIAKQIGGWLRGCRVAVLHGKLKTAEKEQIMQDFVNKKTDVLVATTVIEVGVDVPNATHMIIEGADRFGLAQLHQLRGRVGRGKQKGFCYLIPTDNGQFSKRLQYLVAESDGFKLAEYDLELRGPGAIYGTFQHGALDLRVANITDVKLIARARLRALEFVKRKENLLNYPQLKAHVDALRTITNLN